VTRELRYRLLLAGRSRAALAPAVAWVFVLAGVYAYHPNEVRGSLGITALLLCPITAWLAVALSHAEPAPQRELLTAAAGHTPTIALTLTAAATALLGAVLGLIDVAWPVVTHAFDHTPSVTDIVVGLLAHAGCAAYGAALGTLVGARVIARTAVAFAVLVALAIVSVPLFALAPVLSPAAWTADAMLNSAAIAGPVIALAAHAALVIAVAAAALKRIP
jgi:prolipoprotein diacylglyceryltransferase